MYFCVKHFFNLTVLNGLLLFFKTTKELPPARNIKAFIRIKNRTKKRKNLKQSNCFVLPPYIAKPTACGEIVVLKDMIYL